MRFVEHLCWGWALLINVKFCWQHARAAFFCCLTRSFFPHVFGCHEFFFDRGLEGWEGVD